MGETRHEGYNTAIPASIMTPDRVETRLGPLVFDDGRPTSDTVEKLYDFVDLMHGVQVFLDGIPAASLEAMRAGLTDEGVTGCHQVLIAEDLLDSNPLFLTGNTDTVYAAGLLDLERDGPTVVEIPPGCGPGTVNDAWFRFVVDMGAPGPDRGEGGRYLIVHEDDDSELPDGYFVARSPSYVNWLILRGFLVDGSPDEATRMFRQGLRVHPLAQRATPPEMAFSSFSGRVMNTIHANDVSFYEELARVIRREPLAVIDSETRGVLASIGIHKDRPFEPDERMRALLDEAVRIGNGTARAIAMSPRNPDIRIYDDRRWQTGFVGDDYQWLGGDPFNGRDHDARTMFFYFATVNTPAMALKMVGVGSQYAIAFRDADDDDEYLDGGAHYRLRVPADVPAKDFWSVVVYDPRPARSCRPISRSRAATTSGIRSRPTRTGPSTSGSGRTCRRAGSRATGSRRCRARAGSPSSGSTGRSRPGSTRPGGPATSNAWGEPHRLAGAPPVAIGAAQRVVSEDLPHRYQQRNGSTIVAHDRLRPNRSSHGSDASPTVELVSRQKSIYEVIHSETDEVLSGHRTRQAAIDNWRTRHYGLPVKIIRWPRRSDGPGVLIVEGTWHESHRPDKADPVT